MFDEVVVVQEQGRVALRPVALAERLARYAGASLSVVPLGDGEAVCRRLDGGAPVLVCADATLARSVTGPDLSTLIARSPVPVLVVGDRCDAERYDPSWPLLLPIDEHDGDGASTEIAEAWITRFGSVAHVVAIAARLAVPAMSRAALPCDPAHPAVRACHRLESDLGRAVVLDAEAGDPVSVIVDLTGTADHSAVVLPLRAGRHARALGTTDVVDLAVRSSTPALIAGPSWVPVG